jgi:methylated-DNA-[protein]-cysteine S-methyltransferase
MRMTTGNIFISSRMDLLLISIGKLTSSPIGPIWVALSDRGILAIDWCLTQANFTRLLQKRFHTNVVYDETRTAESLHQLSDYLSGNRHQFDLPIELIGMTPFQLQVMQLTSAIPYGQTSTYKEIAARIGNPHAARAVGCVEATNPIPLVIPCHRVIGSDGKLHGYGGPGGIKLKAWLLELEQARD